MSVVVVGSYGCQVSVVKCWLFIAGSGLCSLFPLLVPSSGGGGGEGKPRLLTIFVLEDAAASAFFITRGKSMT
jgi:hypothetical protein